ncbi:cmd-1 [Symbiodinium natans]|uniref:Cmd-1 protein n=1 Tax=Symbiodinium natans TaxID=878477 RepID=A0A812S5H1_9DINO|nr:cmd-1 [Symbiodinium natans]
MALSLWFLLASELLVLGFRLVVADPALYLCILMYFAAFTRGLITIQERMQRREAEEAKQKEEAARQGREEAQKKALEDWEKQKQAERQRLERYEEKRRAAARAEARWTFYLKTQNWAQVAD